MSFILLDPCCCLSRTLQRLSICPTAMASSASAGGVAATAAAAPAASAASDHAFKSGWLKKRTPGGFFGIYLWQSRFITADEECLRYFRSREDSTDESQGNAQLLSTRCISTCFARQTCMHTGFSCLTVLSSIRCADFALSAYQLPAAFTLKKSYQSRAIRLARTLIFWYAAFCHPPLCPHVHVLTICAHNTLPFSLHPTPAKFPDQQGGTSLLFRFVRHCRLTIVARVLLAPGRH
jgi:hypothetical protein